MDTLQEWAIQRLEKRKNDVKITIGSETTRCS
jgi:hypothetical protein